MQKPILKRNEDLERTGRKKHTALKVIVTIIIILLLCLCFRSCRARDEPVPEPDRVYEENSVWEYEDIVPTQENKRLNIAISDSYRITDERPEFYIGYPSENIFDVILTLKDGCGETLYQTNYIALGTNVGIDGTAFLEKGEQQVECLVSIYSHATGTLISDCTTIVLNINYE